VTAVRSIKFHTYDGIERPPDTVYDVDDAYVETVIALGMAIRVESPKADKPADKPPKSKK
jgi:hypothetical protein